jgi:hypothetical protein
METAKVGWVRAVPAGRWHARAGIRPSTGAFETMCGRVYPTPLSIAPLGPAPGERCERCLKRIDLLAGVR